MIIIIEGIFGLVIMTNVKIAGKKRQRQQKKCWNQKNFFHFLVSFKYGVYYGKFNLENGRTLFPIDEITLKHTSDYIFIIQ